MKEELGNAYRMRGYYAGRYIEIFLPSQKTVINKVESRYSVNQTDRRD
jgi:hypothetical protein